jgi:hypothetical protein
MLSIAQRIPVRIDISWMRPRAGDQPSDPRPTEHELVERSRLVARILEMNPSASSTFLESFKLNDLSAYLNHLMSAAQPRGRLARWIRPDNTPGIAASVPRL